MTIFKKMCAAFFRQAKIYVDSRGKFAVLFITYRNPALTNKAKTAVIPKNIQKLRTELSH